VTGEPPGAPPPPGRSTARRGLVFRSPSSGLSLLYVVALSAGLAALFWSPLSDPRGYVLAWGALFLLPALGAVVLTRPVAEALGGRFSYRRSILLAFTGLALEAPLLGVAHLWDVAWPALAVGTAWMILLVQGPVVWFRDLSLTGVSNPSQERTLPAVLVHPLLTLLGFSFLFQWTVPYLLGAATFLLLGLGTAGLLLRAVDRPIRREFQTSGISLLRPILDHINSRDPLATEILERFFVRFAIPADLSAGLIEFRAGGRAKATLALPTVHPGPFAALGASNLPVKVADRLGEASGVVLVPHTPCNHELDLPSAKEMSRVLDAMETLRGSLTTGPVRAGPLVRPHADSLARAQAIGDAVLVLVSQAPAPTDDIAFSVGDTIRRRPTSRPGEFIALVDAHNSYVEDRGDIAYGTPVARRLAEDAEAAIQAARAAAVDGAPLVGVAVRRGLTIREHGVGPAGIRALVIRAAGRTSALVLIDGNNLVLGARATILAALSDLVDDPEVLTTDNHIVHEVDGSTNPVGGRYPADRLAADCRGVVEGALKDLTPVEVRSGSIDIPGVAVLGPSWTERLLTSLGDTVSVFGHQAAVTLLLLLVSSLVVLVAVR
jgi:putative membrane protein